ncbi:MAG: TonB-dependent receptor [Caulobacterales bacterium]
MTKRILLAGSALATALVAASPLAAQTAQTDSKSASTGIGDIVVTAQKRSESIQQVPIAVTALSEAQLASPTIRDIRDIAGRAPGLVIDTVSAGPKAAAIAIRGISFDDIEKSFDPAVGVVVDGVFVGTNSGQMLDAFDMAGMEVLRGPQGTLFGRNTIGGVINVTRTKPTGEFGGKASVSYSNYDTKQAKFVLNSPMIGDVLALKGFAYYDRTSGFYKEAATGDRAGKDESISGGVTAMFTPNDNVEALLTYEHGRQRGETIAVSLSDGTDIICNSFLSGLLGTPLAPAEQCNRVSLPHQGAYTLFQNTYTPLKNDSDALTANVNIDIGNFTLTSVTGWRENDEDLQQDFDASSVDLFNTRRVQKFEQFSQELRLAGDVTPWLNTLFGAYYYDSNYKLTQNSLFGTGLAGPIPIPVRQDTEGDARSYAAFADVQIRPNDKLTIGGGIRYTKDKKELFDNYGQVPFLVDLTVPGWDGECVQVVGLLAPGVPAYGPASNCDYSKSFSKVTYRGTVDYEVVDDMRVYGSISRGFRSGGFNGRAASPTSVGPYAPEIVDAYEIGLKADWLDKRLRTNLAIYQNDYKDKQEEVVQAAPPGSANPQETVVENAASAKIRGFEGEVIAQPPIDGLTLTGSVSYIDAKYQDFFKDVNGDNIPDDVSTLNLRRAPEWSWSLGADYTRPVGQGDLRLSALFRHIDEYTTCVVPGQPVVLGAVTNDPRCNTKPRDTLDASIGYAVDMGGKDVEFTLFGRNITNDRGVGAVLPVAGIMTFGSARPPRIYGVQVQVKF